MRTLLTIIIFSLAFTAVEARYAPLQLKQYESAQQQGTSKEFLFLHDENFTSYVHLCVSADDTACGGAPDGIYHTTDNVTFAVKRGLLEDPQNTKLSCDYVHTNNKAQLVCADHD